MTGGENQESESKMDLEKLAEIILTRDEKRDDRLSSEMANLASEVSKMATICAVSEQQHQQHREDRNKTDETLKDHGVRIYAVEKQMIALKITDKIAQKRWDRVDKIKAGVVVAVLTAAAIAYLGLKSSAEPVAKVSISNASFDTGSRQKDQRAYREHTNRLFFYAGNHIHNTRTL